MKTQIRSFSAHTYFAKLGTEYEVVDNIQWVRKTSSTPKDVNVVAIEQALSQLFGQFYEERKDKTLTVLVTYNGLNEGDWRVSAVIGISDGEYDIDTAEHISVSLRMTKPENKVEYISVREDGHLFQSFIRYEDDWTVL